VLFLTNVRIPSLFGLKLTGRSHGSRGILISVVTINTTSFKGPHQMSTVERKITLSGLKQLSCNPERGKVSFRVTCEVLKNYQMDALKSVFEELNFTRLEAEEVFKFVDDVIIKKIVMSHVNFH
jgi:hypothetical protein